MTIIHQSTQITDSTQIIDHRITQITDHRITDHQTLLHRQITSTIHGTQRKSGMTAKIQSDIHHSTHISTDIPSASIMCGIIHLISSCPRRQNVMCCRLTQDFFIHKKTLFTSKKQYVYTTEDVLSLH